MRVNTLRDIGLSAASFAWRRMLAGPRFIAVTGSVGKTTATQCLTAALATRYRVNCTERANNGRNGIAKTILRTRRSHDFCVIETGTERPGALPRARIHVRPYGVVFLGVADCHLDGFAGRAEIAREKGALLKGLRGFAVLNGEDPYVMSVAGQCRAKIVTFGRRPEFDYWATEVTSVWPGRLRFRLHTRTGTAMVQTNLVGAHWVDSALGALAAAITCGVPLEDAAASMSRVQPFLARMQPAALPCGATVLRDEYNGCKATSAAALRVLQDAAPCRRVLVHGDLRDTGFAEAERYAMIGKDAAAAADVAVFVGAVSAGAASAAVQAGMAPGNVHGFSGVRQAAEFLKRELRPGDLVLLRGRAKEHLSRLYYEQVRTVRCWKDPCGKTTLCDRCPEL